MDPTACLELYTVLDQMFASTTDVEGLPSLISSVGVRFIPCEFISMWLYEPAENAMVSIVARYTVDGSPIGDVGHGAVRLPIARGPGKGFLENLSAEVVDGVAFEDMPASAYIINDRAADPRCWPKGVDLDDTGLRSELYAPMLFNGFCGMLCALNHPHDAFTRQDYELLAVLANKTALAVRTLQEKQRADAATRLAMLGRAVDLVRHEMQSPLTVIKGATHIMQKLMAHAPPRSTRDESTLVEMLDLIAAEVEHNTQILAQIREYCQPRLTLQCDAEDLNAFLSAQQDAIRAAMQATGREAALRLILGDAVPTVAISRHHLLGVLRNLARNACDAGSHSVTLRTGHADDAAWIRVEDDGGGVDDPLLAVLFEPYESTRVTAGGSGLGLFLCRRVMEEGHSGRIGAENIFEDGARRGLRVHLSFPTVGFVDNGGGSHRTPLSTKSIGP